MAQYADALGKIASQLNVPPQVLWEKLPGVTQTDVERWREEASELMFADAQAQATAFGVTGVTVTDAPREIDATAIKSKADALGVLIRSGVDPESAADQVGLMVDFTGAVPVSLRLPDTKASGLETK